MSRIAERASKEGARVNVTPLTEVEGDKKLINVTFELEEAPGPSRSDALRVVGANTQRGARRALAPRHRAH